MTDVWVKAWNAQDARGVPLVEVEGRMSYERYAETVAGRYLSVIVGLLPVAKAEARPD